MRVHSPADRARRSGGPASSRTRERSAERLGALGAPAVADGALDVTARGGERAQVGDAGGGCGDVVRLAQRARPSPAGAPGRSALGAGRVRARTRPAAGRQAARPVRSAPWAGRSRRGRAVRCARSSSAAAQPSSGLTRTKQRHAVPPVGRAAAYRARASATWARAASLVRGGHGVLQVEDGRVGARRPGLGQPVGSGAGDEEQGAQRGPRRVHPTVRDPQMTSRFSRSASSSAPSPSHCR